MGLGAEAGGLRIKHTELEFFPVCAGRQYSTTFISVYTIIPRHFTMTPDRHSDLPGGQSATSRISFIQKRVKGV